MRKRIPSVKSLEAAFPGKGKVLRQLLASDEAVNQHPAVQDFVRRCFHHPGIGSKRMVALDAEAETYGVEYIKGNGSSPSFEYLNTGDTYTPTIIRFASGTYRVADWGSIVERGNYA